MKISIQHAINCLLAGTVIALAGCGGSNSSGAAGGTSNESGGSSTATGGTNTGGTGTGNGSGTGTGTGSGTGTGTGTGTGMGSGTGTGSNPTPPPTGSPTISTQPASQTVSVGQSALFRVTATQASSYQWNLNDNPISGANAATYSAPAAAAGDTGEKFSVTVTNSLGSIKSNEVTLTVNPNADGSPPAAFWGNTAALPPATQTMMFSFVNQTNGKYPDGQIFWSEQGHTADNTVTVNEIHSIADQATFDMPALTSARMYFTFAPDAATAAKQISQQSATTFWDFLEFNIGRSKTSVPYNFNGDTTRVDAFGMKIAIKLHCADGTDVARGEDYGAFLEDRAITFQKYLNEVPAEFQATGTINAPYRIVQPGANGAGFIAGEANATYYDAYVDTMWANNKITLPKPTPFLNGIGPADLSAALERHVGDAAGTFNPDGTLVNGNFWANTPSTSFYEAAPANYYAKFWHSHGIGGFAYGFPYDDVGGHSSDISCNSPTYLVVAIGW